MRTTIAFLVLLIAIALSQHASACDGDYDCSFGAVCTKVNGPYQPGICVTGQNGIGIYGNEPQGHQINGCQYDNECDTGFNCKVPLGQTYGYCIGH